MVTKARQAKITQVTKQKLTDVRVILEDIHDPHNAAAILRTVDGLGIGSVWYLFDQEEPYDPKKIGKLSSATANRWVDITVFTDRQAIDERLCAEQFVSYASALHETNSLSLWEGDYTKGKLALWVGNEQRGLSDAAKQFCDHSLVIPMLGFVESFNVSVAAAIMMAEIVRQRRCTQSGI